ncbi:quinone-dependent dihydroorotate dehydrogenase [Pedosphaera parvula]|uniref:Dihydroorotate dehydrogenase (quinone) n=1 Tax=Pedosphaera parvula (strain Ellin514) TaxID=320771 RepID=B9XSG1_PEDPL|nr:quinone-dependent dihydroorotate dehydrogenase [Pedosphaera parvula]EEF57226.1 Dihydroorotate oxidase [Pedosphaera parvula Ellin514]
MGWPYRHLLRPLLFKQDSEEIHNQTLSALAWASHRPWICDAVGSFFGSEQLPVELFGLKFPNPVGLAAGMDKQAAAVPMWSALGFGFTELGGVTWHQQPGNPMPRMFRAARDQALINRMGFNNPGAEAMAARLKNWHSQNRWPSHPVGINLGKSKITPLEEAAQDYSNSFRVLWPYADFFVVNVSSPNTPNLRQLQDKTALNEILSALQQVNREQLAQPFAQGRSPKPILVKVAPDLTYEALDEILELVGPRELSGIVATNTTIARPPTRHAQSSRTYAETGGLSGRPLAKRSTEIIRHLYRQTSGKVPIIGVGGIFNADDAWDKITAGASLIQVYSGMVYEGPGIAKNINSGLLKKLENKGISSIAEAVGMHDR